MSHSQVLPELGREHWRLSRSTVVLPSDERTRTTILSVLKFPVLTGHTVGPRTCKEMVVYAELLRQKVVLMGTALHQ